MARIIIYTGPKRNDLALYPHKKWVLEAGEELPDLVKAAMDASPAFANLFQDFSEFSSGVPPGAPSERVPVEAPPIRLPAPIRKR